MKQKMKMNYVIVISTMVFSVNAVNAQDTTKVKTTVIDSVRTTTTVRDTMIAPKEEKNFYHGEVGARYLPTFTALSFRNTNGDVVEGKSTMSHGFGVMFGYNFTKYVGIQAEINYDRISQKYKDGELDRQISINYINVPVLLTVNTDKTCPVVFGIAVGPQFAFNMGSSFDGSSGTSTDTLHAELAMKPGDVGVSYSAGFGFTLDKEKMMRLDLGFRGLFGLVDMSSTPSGDNSFNILVAGSRKTYGGYLGLTLLF